MAIVSAEILVHAPLKQAYRAFANSTSLREWLCDAATVKAIPSVAGLLNALRLAVDETLAYIALLPGEFAANKGSDYRFASGLVQPNFHFTSHVQQIRDAIAAARK